MPDDRDVRTVKTPPAAVRLQTAPPVEEIPDDMTGQHLALPEEERAADKPRVLEMRRRRTDSERIENLEGRVDGLAISVANIDGKLEVLPAFIEEVRSVMKERHERETITLRREVDIDVARERAEIETDAAREHAKIEQDKAKAIAEVRAEIKDKLDKRSARRKLFLKIFGGGLGAAAIVLAHKLVQLWWGWL